MQMNRRSLSTPLSAQMNFEILVFRISWVLIRFYDFPFAIGRVLTVIELKFVITKNNLMININEVT